MFSQTKNFNIVRVCEDLYSQTEKINKEILLEISKSGRVIHKVIGTKNNINTSHIAFNKNSGIFHSHTKPLPPSGCDFIMCLFSKIKFNIKFHVVVNKNYIFIYYPDKKLTRKFSCMFAKITPSDLLLLDIYIKLTSCNRNSITHNEREIIKSCEKMHIILHYNKLLKQVKKYEKILFTDNTDINKYVLCINNIGFKIHVLPRFTTIQHNTRES